MGLVTAASAVVSGSIALVGNVVYWFERQGRCKRRRCRRRRLLPRQRIGPAAPLNQCRGLQPRSSTISAPAPPCGALACEGQHIGVLAQPALHLALEHRLPPGRAVALAVHHAQAAPAARRRFAHEAGQFVAGFARGAGRAGRVHPGSTNGRGAAGSPPRAPRRRDEAQAVVGEQQRFQVHLVGQGLAAAPPVRRLRAGAAAARAAAGWWLAVPSGGRGVTGPTVGKQAPGAFGGRCAARCGAFAATCSAARRFPLLQGIAQGVQIGQGSRSRAMSRSLMARSFTSGPFRPSTPPAPGRRRGGRARARPPV
jgi:hypothetical protein